MTEKRGDTFMALFLWAVIGLLAGWVATQLLAGRDGALSQNLTAGLIGSVVGGYLFTHLSPALNPSFFGSLLTALIGAAAVLVVWRVIRRA